MNRRQAIPIIAAAPLALAGCGDDPALSVTRRFRVIATVEVDGELVEASTVMEVTYRKLTRGADTKLYGEALILDLKGRQTIYLLPIAYARNGVMIGNLYESGILTTLGISGGVGVIDREKINVVRSATGRLPFHFSSSNLPTLLPITVAFQDEKRPETIYDIDLRKIDMTFSGVRFVSLDVEFSNLALTSMLPARLPWTKRRDGRTAFPRDPPGQGRHEADSPLAFKIIEDHFYADGSR